MVWRIRGPQRAWPHERRFGDTTRDGFAAQLFVLFARARERHVHVSPIGANGQWRRDFAEVDAATREDDGVGNESDVDAAVGAVDLRRERGGHGGGSLCGLVAIHEA